MAGRTLFFIRGSVVKLLLRIAAVLFALLLVLPAEAFAAYTCTISTQETIFGVDGRKYMHIILAETEARDTSQCTITGVPPLGTVVSYRADRTAGTGATIDPLIGLSSGFAASSINQVWDSPTTADFVTFQGMVFVYYSSSGTLYLLSRPNNIATDHSISTDLLIAFGGP